MNIEYEIYTATCKTLHSKLKERIKGGIVTKVYNDTLHIEIYNDGFDFKYEYNHWLDYVHYSGNLDRVVDDVVKQYRSAVLRKYMN